MSKKKKERETASTSVERESIPGLGPINLVVVPLHSVVAVGVGAPILPRSPLSPGLATRPAIVHPSIGGTIMPEGFVTATGLLPLSASRVF